MKKIVVQDSYAFIYLNKQVYSKEALKQTITDFKEFITPSYKEFGNYITLKLEANTTDYSLETLSNEFMNYLCGVQFQMGGMHNES